jgi:hypothetical protein
MIDKNMRIAFGSGASLLLLAACSGGGTTSSPASVPGVPQSAQARQASSASRMTVPPTGRVGLPANFRGSLFAVKEKSPGWLSAYAKSSGAKIYVSDFDANAVYIYNAYNPGSPVGTITSGLDEPLGNFVDSSGNLYVANLGTNTVTVYPQGQTSPTQTYSSGLAGPIGVVVGSDGTVYVPEFEAGEVVEYDSGQTTPSRTISISEPEGVALDPQNNLFVSYSNASTGQGAVEEFAPKATAGKDLGISVQFPGDIKLGKLHSDIILEDQIAETVNFYHPRSTTPYGSIAAGVDTYKLALNASETFLYIGDFSNSVPIYQKKASGLSEGTITTDLEASSGVSLSPAPPFEP